MQRIVIIANGAAYGSESLFNSLRLAIALREQQSDLELKLFLMSDAVTAGLRGQKPAEGYNIQQMLEIGDQTVFNQNIQFHFMLPLNADKFPVRNTDQEED